MEKEKTVLEILAQLEREAAGAESDDTATWNPEPGDQRSGIILRFEEVQTRNGPRWVLEIESATVGVFPFWPGVIPLRKLRNQRAAPGDGVVIKRLGMKGQAKDFWVRVVKAPKTDETDDIPF